PDVVYFRLHGSPRMYHSSYTASYLKRLGAKMKKIAASGRSVWCIFDNTAYGVATGNAFELLELLHRGTLVQTPVRKKPVARRAARK
ncbi:MAG: DUF72 domain-containing protein, partial [Burkholderiales bacterium]